MIIDEREVSSWKDDIVDCLCRWAEYIKESWKVLVIDGKSDEGGLHLKDKYYMDLAFQVSKGSKCVRAQYGSVIVHREGHIVTTGYNGKPAGSCNDGVCYREGLPPNAPKENCCLHSEVNAITFAGRERCVGGTLFVCGIPCNDCVLVILQSGVSRLVYYDGLLASGHRGSSNDDYWEKYGSTIERVAYSEERWQALYGVK